MPEKSEFFIMIGRENSHVLSFDAEIRAAFVGIKLLPDGSTTLYFHLPKTTGVGDAMQFDDRLIAQFLRTDGIMSYNRTCFDVIKAGTGPFQIAYELRFIEQEDTDG